MNPPFSLQDGQKSAIGGVSTAILPDQLGPTQIAWGFNIANRGGKIATRPAYIERARIPKGPVQGIEYFSADDGMLVFACNGMFWRIIIRGNSVSYDYLPVPYRNSSRTKNAWMVETANSFVIQDGQSAAVVYDGSTAYRGTGIPVGTVMAWIHGRLWVAAKGNQLLAGDIAGTSPNSDLNFTEGIYLNGGGSFTLPRDIYGMGGLPQNDDTAGFGPLVVCGHDYAHCFRADITRRELWNTIPKFETIMLRDIGTVSQASIVEVNQDLYFRSPEGEIWSLRSARTDEGSPGRAPISREVSRITDHEDPTLLGSCSAVYFDNRLLMTASPFRNMYGGVSFKKLVSLDLTPIGAMQGKFPPAYDGEWTGINFVRVVAGMFAGKKRAFAVSTDEDGENRLWEFMPNHIADGSQQVSGSTSVNAPVNIQSFAEYRRFDFAAEGSLKKLERVDLYLGDVQGPIDVKVQYRADGRSQWQSWDEETAIAKMTDPAGTAPHVWKNLNAQARGRLKTFSIKPVIDPISKTASNVGFDFQIRVSWTGHLRIERLKVFASLSDESNFAQREGWVEQSIQSDATGNQIGYVVPVGGIPVYYNDQDGVIYADENGVQYSPT